MKFIQTLNGFTGPLDRFTTSNCGRLGEDAIFADLGNRATVKGARDRGYTRSNGLLPKRRLNHASRLI
jgi:hypothetical protein